MGHRSIAENCQTAAGAKYALALGLQQIAIVTKDRNRMPEEVATKSGDAELKRWRGGWTWLCRSCMTCQSKSC